MRAAIRIGAGCLEGAGRLDARLDARLLMEHVLGVSRMELFVRMDDPAEADSLSAYQALIQKRAEGEPAAYLLGEQPFMGLPFQVTRDVLVPRQDTEVLCERAVAYARQMDGCKVLDWGTGSGALAVSLAVLAKAQVCAVDISPAALAVAEENARRNGAEVVFCLGDGFAALESQFAGRTEGLTFDLILSNPPYIPSGDLAGLMAEVRREPSLALDGGVDGLEFYRRIAMECSPWLRPKGRILLEVGMDQAAPVAELLHGQGFETQCHLDWNGIQRVVEGWRPG